MSKAIQSVRGMNDITPEVIPYWHKIEGILRQLTQSFGYQEIRFPIVESTGLFKRSIGDVTDIVEKEMYTFADRNGDSLSLRPEGTAGCVRAGIERGLLYNQTQRLWYCGPMFRHEKPQKGRYRQFHQFGLEAFGLSGPLIDAEIIHFSYALWQACGLQAHIHLALNTVGTSACRKVYAQQLVDYFTPYENQLDEDNRRRLKTNPLRILDTKNADLFELVEGAPRLLDCLSTESRQFFDNLCELLTLMNIPYVHNPRIVRGLDYYTHTVFEWVTQDLGAQGTVCGGGRYDGLVELLGGHATPAVGFGLGIERLVELYQLKHSTENLSYTANAYMVLLGEAAEKWGMQVAMQIREQLPQFKLVCHLNGGKVKNQFKAADKSGASIALVIGDEEAESKTVTLKLLREQGPQVTYVMQELIHVLMKHHKI